ncbi:DegT/DnrJ/EryC1/StrS family aminotransferase, partial [Enterobacter hormaechei subsp. steigerwaltii]|nr:DegT/DnrJ/EryC1/StrS family aminotransferase [Enterobacter hormaechei subsp. steigerwaltii]
ERAEIIREKGTNRSQFFRGQVDKYTWRDIGSSYLMSDLQAAYLWAQLEAADRINQQRLALWQNYYDALAPLAKAGRIDLTTEELAAVCAFFTDDLGSFDQRFIVNQRRAAFTARR